MEVATFATSDLGSPRKALCGGTINIKLLPSDTLDSEDLIDQVADGEIDYTIADQELARLAKTYYPNIDISVEVGFAQRLRWFTSPYNEGLAKALDEWAKDIPQEKAFKTIYRKYFELNKSEDTTTDQPRPPTERLPRHESLPVESLSDRGAPSHRARTELYPRGARPDAVRA